MLIRHMDAVFSKPQTLTLSDGLNILQTPSEAANLSWCAFLLSMLYGAGEQDLHVPWPAASGRLDCRAGDDALVLLRATRSPDLPMGEFRALYAGTDTQVPGLDGSNCGKTLLGISREVFAGSALIRPGQPLPGRNTPKRRTLSSKSKNTSTADGGEIGQLPSLESELRETESLLAIRGQLVQKLERTQEQIKAVENRASALEAELTALDYQEALDQQEALRQAWETAGKLEQRAEDLRRRITEEGIPETGTVSRLRGAIVNLETARKAAVKAREERDAAERALRQAEEAAAGSSFAGLTPEEAEQRTLDLPPKPRYPLWCAALALILGLGLCGSLYYIGASSLPAALACGFVLAGAVLLFGGLIAKRQRKRWEAIAEERRTQWQEALKAHALLCQAVDAARARDAEKSAAYEALATILTSSEQGILLEIHRFAPAASDIPACDAALRASAILRKGLAEADAAARDARLHYERLAQQAPSEELPAPSSLPASSRSREAVAADLAETRDKAAALRAEAAQLSARLNEAGDPAALRAAAERLADRIAALQMEHAAAQASLSASARTAPAPEIIFTPAMSRRASEIFNQLTSGTYDAPVLDQALQAFLSSGASRDGMPLPAGDADLLELAARVARCELALPKDKAVPMILDDALSPFDDQRCAAALRWLRKAAEARQILLFTCRSREAAFFAGDPDVSIQHLTGPV